MSGQCKDTVAQHSGLPRYQGHKSGVQYSSVVSNFRKSECIANIFFHNVDPLFLLY